MIRYQVTVEFHDNAKARLRTSLRLLGATSLRIAEVAAPEAKREPVKPDNLPTSQEAKAMADLFGRKHSHPWADDEIAAFKAAIKRGVLTLENIAEVAAYYRRERKKDGNFCRTTILTAIRHFDGELDKARQHRPERTKALEWPAPANVVPMPELSEEARAAGVEALRRTRQNIAGPRQEAL